jgi:translation initiation factor 3 subunit B
VLQYYFGKFVSAENILAFAWEPVGTKFAFIHGEAPKIGVSFYNIKKAGHVEHIHTLDKRQANHLFWSPNGRFLVLAGLRTMSSVLEFIDTNDMTVMATTEHFMATGQ